MKMWIHMKGSDALIPHEGRFFRDLKHFAYPVVPADGVDRAAEIGRYWD